MMWFERLLMKKKCAAGILGCLLSLGLALGCVDPEEEGGGSTGGTSLYVFDASDGASNRILVYSDLAALFEDTTIEPSRRLGGSKIDTVKNLAWGGMCFDAEGNRLYLVSETGDVIRIERARIQNGTPSNLDIASFRLGESGDRLSSGIFGQASIDSMANVLYVTESNPSDARVWVVNNPNAQQDGSTYNSNGNYLFISGDKGDTGVAANNGYVYAYFDSGSSVRPTLDTEYTGPRLRRGTSSGFSDISNMIIGSVSTTRLAKYGCLAIDQDSQVYFARHLTDAAVGSGNAILFFRPGQFNPGWNQAPERTFAAISNLRIISHAITRDWLVGALSNGDAGRDIIWMWRSPSSSSPSSQEFRVGSNASIRGLALDGKN
jgi:hypothetical protein